MEVVDFIILKYITSSDWGTKKLHWFKKKKKGCCGLFSPTSVNRVIDFFFLFYLTALSLTLHFKTFLHCPPNIAHSEIHNFAVWCKTKKPGVFY